MAEDTATVPTIRIGCKLPQGFVIQTGAPGGKDYSYVELAGANRPAKGVRYGITAVPVAVWSAWLAKNKTFRYVRDKSIFVV